MDAKQHAAAAFSNAQQAAQQLANFLAPGELQGKGRCLDDCAKYVGLAQSHAHAAADAEQADQHQHQQTALLLPNWDPYFAPLSGQPPASVLTQFQPVAQPAATGNDQSQVQFPGWDPHMVIDLEGSEVSGAPSRLQSLAAPGAPRPSKAPAPIPLKDHPSGSWRGGIGATSHPQRGRSRTPPPPPPPPARQPSVFQTMGKGGGKPMAAKSAPPPLPPGQLRLSDGTPLI